MIKKFRFKTCSFVLVCLVLSACEAVFIPDPIDPRLPKYTESGNDVAGAIVNGEYWKSIVDYGWYTIPNPDIIVFPNDSLVIKFISETGAEKSFDIQFNLVGFDVSSMQDLTKLNNQKIALDGTINQGVVTSWSFDDESCYEVQGGIGQLYTKHIVYDAEHQQVLFSGTFGFTIPDTGCGSFVVEYGRFDYSVGSYNFRTGF